MTATTTQATPCQLWLLTGEKTQEKTDRWFQEMEERVERAAMIALINVTKG